MREVPYTVAVEELRQSPYYIAILDKVENLRMPIPPFNYSGESNIEEIKFKLAQNQMLDLVLQHMKPR